MRGFLLGAMVGALAAMLVAPRRGEETREMVRVRVDRWQDQVMAKFEQARGDVESLRREMVTRLDELRSQLSRTSEEMKIRTERQGQAAEAAPPTPPTVR